MVAYGGGQQNKYNFLYVIYLVFFILNFIFINILYFHDNECIKYWYVGWITSISSCRIISSEKIRKRNRIKSFIRNVLLFWMNWI